jgi:hypothetical protein
MAANAEVGPAGLGAAESVADRVLSLPLSPAHTEEQIDQAAAALVAALDVASP